MRKIHDISPTLNPAVAVWPGDVTFSRTIALDTEKGDHLTLSSIQTTVHVGAHADAPNHYGGKNGIADVPLEPYWGKCQLIEVGKKKLIGPEDLPTLKAPRVLFRTSSFPDPDHFNTDFTALSVPLVEALSKKGVILVGIDTPSVDPFESKDLQAHHAILAAKIAVLEGLVLDGIPEGIYELCALPLKIAGADASPVRAVLREGPFENI